jgi:hypothetical protein
MKLALFGELIEEEKFKHVEKIKRIIKIEKLENSNISKEYQIYLINHYLISLLMIKILEDSSSL